MKNLPMGFPGHPVDSDFTGSSGSSSDSPHLDHLINLRYKQKWKRLKKIVKTAIFENAALCDEVALVQEKILITKEERRFLLKKLLNFEGVKEIVSVKSSNSQPSTSGYNDNGEPKKKKPLKKKSKDLDDHIKTKSKRKKSTEKKLVPPIPLDTSGRPIFPILLGTIRIHSLGEIVYDRPGFFTEESMFPVGFCSSRFFVSFKNPSQCVLYTCTVMDQLGNPRFEIMAEDDCDHPLVGNTATDCHTQLLTLVNKACGREVVPSEGKGTEFFGFYHPVVRNLIQSCPGARKCVGYRWVKFEVNKSAPLVTEIVAITEAKPTISFASYQQLLVNPQSQETKPVIKSIVTEPPSPQESVETNKSN